MCSIGPSGEFQERRSVALKGGRAILLFLPAFMLSAYPLAVVARANVGTLPLDMFVIGRSMLVAIGAIIFIVWLLRIFQSDLAARTMWTNWVLLLLTFYESALEQLRLLGFTTSADDPLFASIYVLVALTIGTIVSRPWRVQHRSPIPLNLFAAALLGITLYPVAAWGIAADDVSWRRPADALITSALSAPAQAKAVPARDIYYIILDGLGRRDTLAEIYDVDLGALVTFLKNKGFQVADEAQSNYAQTYLSLASTLNLSYLDDVAAVMRGSRDRHPLDYLVQNNALMQAARKAGYRVVGISSDYLVTERWDGADICLCPRYGLDEFEQNAIWKTPLAALPLERWTHGAHRRKVARSLEAIDGFASHDAPVFLLAHVIVPHPPFVFGPDGSPRRPARGVKFDFGDGDHFVGSRQEYISGYRDQTQFVIGQLTTLVESLLSRPGTAPVIVIHGDHGPGSMLDWNVPRSTNMRERMGIFAAYHFPDPGPALYPSLSPVNGARALATRYLGLQLPPVADKSSFSTWSDPYAFIPVEPMTVEARVPSSSKR